MSPRLISAAASRWKRWTPGKVMPVSSVTLKGIESPMLSGTITRLPIEYQWNLGSGRGGVDGEEAANMEIIVYGVPRD